MYEGLHDKKVKNPNLVYDITNLEAGIIRNYKMFDIGNQQPHQLFVMKIYLNICKRVERLHRRRNSLKRTSHFNYTKRQTDT